MQTVEPKSLEITPEAVARVPLLRAAGPRALGTLLSRGRVVTFEPEETLWRAGSQAHGLLLVLEGEVRVVGTVGGRRHVVHVEDAGGTLGEVPLFAGGGHPATAVASRRTKCLALDRDALAAAMREDSEFAFALLNRLALRLREVIGRLDRVTAQTVAARLADHILRRAAAAGQSAFTLGGTQTELAEDLGTAREVIVRTLRRLRVEGAIQPAGRGRWQVTDRSKLLEAVK